MPKRLPDDDPHCMDEAPPFKRSVFKPSDIGLPEEFCLTDYTRLKGCSCKLPQTKLLTLLQAISASPGKQDVGMDCSIVPLSHRNERGECLFLVSTTDFFFPSVEDPFLQGQIGAANVLSDLYSMGIANCDTVLMLLATSTDMDETEQDITTREIMRGFSERVRLAGCNVTGGQTVMNPWPLIGGVAMRAVAENEMVRPAGLMEKGDVLVLTKPLGNQVAVNLKQWLKRPSLLYEECVKGHITDEDIDELYLRATESMKRLNRTGAALMLKYKAHGATDVTGFGILGHAKNFGAAQAEAEHASQLCLLLDRLPIFRTAVQASRLMNDKYRLLEGLSAETSGGLLVALQDESTAEQFMKEIEEVEGQPAWLVGRIVERTLPDGPYARLHDAVEIVEV